MASPGFVYILINSALPGLLKLGITARDPEERARELQGTGLPTPFAVAHQLYVQDCERVERAVHSLLAEHRVADNREFFSISVDDAIAAISIASRLHASRGATHASDSQAKLDLSRVQISVLYEADDYRFGANGRLRDPERAIRTYEKAAALGALRAYWSLGDLLLSRAKHAREYAAAVSWLNKGVELGFRWCWSLLADYYTDRHSYSSDPDGLYNARVCLGNLLRNIEPRWIEDDGEEREIFFRLRDFVKLCAGNPSAAELSNMDDALRAMEGKVRALTDRREQIARLRQLDDLRAGVDSLRLGA